MWGQPRGSSSLLFGTNRWIKSLASISRPVSPTVSSRKMPQGTVMVHQTLRNNGFYPKKNHLKKAELLTVLLSESRAALQDRQPLTNAPMLVDGVRSRKLIFGQLALPATWRTNSTLWENLLIDISPRSCRTKKILWGKPNSSTGGKHSWATAVCLLFHQPWSLSAKVNFRRETLIMALHDKLLRSTDILQLSVMLLLLLGKNGTGLIIIRCWIPENLKNPEAG